MSPEHYGVLHLVLHWQQWYVLVVALIGILLSPLRPTRTLQFAGVFWSLLFVWVLWTAGFFTGGM